MDKRSAVMLTLAVLVLMTLAYLSVRDTDSVETELGRLVFTDLNASLDQVTQVRINLGQQAVSLEKQAGEWRVVDRKGYSADMPQVSRLLRSLADMVYLEPKTSRPERFVSLSLANKDAQQGAATYVELQAPNQLWSLLVGAAPVNRGGQYIRLPAQDQAWLVDQRLMLDSSPAQWLSPVILNVDSEQVKTVILSRQNAGMVKIGNISAASGEIENARVTNLPGDVSVTYTGAADEVTRALVNLRLQDVQALNNIDWQDAIAAQFELVDNKTLLIRGVMVAGECWISVSLGSDFSPQERLIYGLGDDVEQWAYKVSQYNYQLLARQMVDFIEAEAL
ncbi:DUF4340 domain-containing protein [Pseudomonadales bacterium]|nr:DUF4340 domain-containing protein [Pseudomonadales bacterium]MDB4068556.1 DUF4340 domain-containing protein [Pseudomonadales bacterium]MDB4150650.1 DUF4340 domain-containing protein [Pseudomonadales bacterium]MDB9866981.1 DUF4340 domain-containing protein [Pseudomonadales bacterium]MDB9917057.1 DUF4340 domain-containing protein [Pseudomonadales bacterium]